MASKPMKWSELRGRVESLDTGSGIDTDVVGARISQLLTDIDAAAPAMTKLEALADCCGELDADNVKTCSVPSWMRVRSYVVAQIQDAWLDYKGVKRDG